MRTTKVLLVIMLENIEKFRYGLCGLVSILLREDIITRMEFNQLIEYIEANPPKKTYDESYYWKPGNKKPRERWLYYWKPGNKKPRERWLNKHIEKLTKP
jgi:hypothetical protein